MEKDIINIIERHKEDINLNNNQLIIKMKCTPISKTGKELFEILNYVVQENYILTLEVMIMNALNGKLIIVVKIL